MSKLLLELIYLKYGKSDDKLWDEGLKIWDEGEELWAESDDKLWDEGDKLYAEGRKLFIDAVVEVYGKNIMEWEKYGCSVDGREFSV